jgi:hypothetical protein
MAIFYNRRNLENKGGFYVDYMFKSPDNETEEKYFSYNVPFDVYMEGVKVYFDVYDVSIEGTDGNVFNSLLGLDALKELEEVEFFVDFLKEKCKEDAYEKFKEEFEEEKELDNE